MTRKSNLSTLATLFSWVVAMFAALGVSAAVAQDSVEGAVAADSQVPLYFEKNQGQAAGEVHFLARAGGYTAFLTSQETVLHYHNGVPGQKTTRDAVVRMTLSGSPGASTVRGDERLPGLVNYLIGNDPSKWRTRIPTYGEVHYAGVYPG